MAGTTIALWPPPASAQQGARAHVEEGAEGSQNPVLSDVIYEAGSGEKNDVTIAAGANDTELVIDDVVPIEAGQNCVHPDEADLTRVICTVETTDPKLVHLDVTLGDLNDTLESRAPGKPHVEGGPGDDVLDAASTTKGETAGILGGPGNDTLSGANNLYGGEGDDTITGTIGYDTILGGPGSDTIQSSGGFDVIYGEDATFRGSGDDEIHAGGGDDLVYGEGGADTIHGDDGVDWLYGDDGDDELHGGPGEDLIDGGPGDDDESQD
ncbi:calcium-binding protein [Streptomyces sp. 6N223]|uniref:calcium-binding protein n=1 Tax=Streptomyces sp. 6N223 TaxID=3457412 RepID=UPI003FD65027